MSDNVTRIEEKAFYMCHNIEKIKLSNKLLRLGENCFSGCSALTSIELPDSIYHIGSNAFDVCTGLNHIKMPAKLKTTGLNVFRGCKSLTEIDLPHSLESLDNIFYDCKNLKKVTLCIDNLEYIYRDVFDNCNKQIVIGIFDSGEYEEYSLNEFKKKYKYRM